MLVLGIILSTYRFGIGIELAVFGLVIIVVTLIIFVAATEGIDTYPPGDMVSGPHP